MTHFFPQKIYVNLFTIYAQISHKARQQKNEWKNVWKKVKRLRKSEQKII